MGDCDDFNCSIIMPKLNIVKYFSLGSLPYLSASFAPFQYSLPLLNWHLALLR